MIAWVMYDPHAYSAPVYPGQPPVTQSQTQQPPSLDRDGDSIPDIVSPGSPSVDRPVADRIRVLSEVISLSKTGLIAMYPCSNNILAWASMSLCFLLNLAGFSNILNRLQGSY